MFCMYAFLVKPGVIFVNRHSRDTDNYYTGRLAKISTDTLVAKYRVASIA